MAFIILSKKYVFFYTPHVRTIDAEKINQLSKTQDFIIDF